MAEAATQNEPIDLLNLDGLVASSEIAELHRLRNCLVHAMDPYDIVRVVWELVSKLPMMQMHRMYSTREIFETSRVHLEELSEGCLKPLDDGKQKMILCPVYLPLRRKYPGKRLIPSTDNEYMDPLRSRDKVTNKGVLEQLILVDRDACFHVLEAYWETPEELSQSSYQRFRQLKEISLKDVKSALDLYHILGSEGDMVAFFYHTAIYLQKILDASLRPIRRDFEKSVGVEGEGDQLEHEKYLTFIRANNLFNGVRNQVHHRYGTR